MLRKINITFEQFKAIDDSLNVTFHHSLAYFAYKDIQIADSSQTLPRERWINVYAPISSKGYISGVLYLDNYQWAWDWHVDNNISQHLLQLEDYHYQLSIRYFQKRDIIFLRTYTLLRFKVRCQLSISGFPIDLLWKLN